MRSLAKISATLILLFTTWDVARSEQIGIKNFRQIMESYLVMTGLPRSNPNIAQLMQRVRTRLPLKGEISDVSSPVVVTLTEMAGVFCQEAIAYDAARPRDARKLHKLVNFQGGATSLTPTIQTAVLEDYTRTFWQRAATAEEQTGLTSAFQTAIQSTQGGAQGPETTKAVLKIMCVSIASSLEVLTY